MMNKNKEMTDWYCPLPFKHAFVDSNGISSCCQLTRQQTSLDEWHTNPKLLQLQQQTLLGTAPAQCQACVTQEQLQGHSLRTDSWADYNHEKFTATDIDFVDYRSSNICNFKCRSCAPEFSHGIAKETRDTVGLQKFNVVVADKTVGVDETNRTWIVNNLSNIKRLMFTGGEPTVIPEVKLILEEVRRQNIHDLSVLITTNGSFVDKFWYDITQEFTNLHWTVSVDAVDHAAEIVRHGTNWTTVEHNLRWLSKHARSMDINTVVSNLNVLQLAPLLRFVREIQLQSIDSGQMGSDGCRHQFFVCQRPYMLAADNWPDQMIVLEYLNHCLALDLDSAQRSTIENLVDAIRNNPFKIELWAKSVEYNAILDNIRNEDHNILRDPTW
jgi:sulfatase maturation enzyme AslB (radical SAM superfamily)